MLKPTADRDSAHRIIERMVLSKHLLADGLSHCAKTADRFRFSQGIMQDADQALYILKDFVDYHLIRIIRNDFGAKRMEEYGRFFDFPASIDALREQKRRIANAIRFFTPRKSPLLARASPAVKIATK